MREERGSERERGEAEKMRGGEGRYEDRGE